MKLTRLPIFLLQFAASVAAAQTTWYVDDDCAAPGSGTQLDPFCKIQDGVDAAQHGDTVLVGPGIYAGDGNRDISLFGKQIMLRSSEGPASTILDIQGGPTSIHRGFFLIHGETRETLIEGFSIINGYLIGDTGGSGAAGGGGGAGVYLGNSSPTIRNCVLQANTSRTLGNPFVHDGRGGGLLLDRASSALIEKCVMIGNEADKQGGGMLHIGGEDTSVSIRNCLFALNSADRGGGIHNAGPIGLGSVARYENNTVINNFASIAGGGFQNGHSQALIRNCIIWGNASDFAPQIYAPSALLSVEYSDVEAGLDGAETPEGIEWGAGNIDADPLFFDPDNGDYRLLPGSPCLDAGNNLAVPDGVVSDLDGGPRFLDDPDTTDSGNPDGINPIVDMGPYEYDPADCNNNDTPDADELDAGTSTDCNNNNVPDECELDCNDSGQEDSCDVADGSSDDCNGNFIPDECEADCNDNGQQDTCDIAQEVSDDCDANGVPDECDPDCNANGEVDACDILTGVSEDCDGDLIPDECDPGPTILGHPTDQEMEDGAAFAVFQVEAEGVVLLYQWRKDGVELTDGVKFLGTNDDTMLVVDVKPEDVGAYDCVVMELLDSTCTTSLDAALTVLIHCPADLDGDGFVNVPDLIILLGAWGPNPDHPADFDADGQVRVPDLLTLLGAWGACS